MTRPLLLAVCAAMFFVTAALNSAAAAPWRPGAASASAISQDARAALQRLYAENPKAQQLGAKAHAILVFPQIVKAGLVMAGGQSGDGALIERGKVTSFYNITAASFGLQAGAQTFSYALFFITPSALAYLSKSDGWAVGSGPSVVVVDKGKAGTLNTTTLTQDVYVVPFGQHGLMAGVGIEGSKITQIHPKS